MKFAGLAFVLFAGSGSIASAGSAPPGVPSQSSGNVNNYACVPSAAHPDPVVLLHGGFANYQEDINLLQAQLGAEGYCTFSFTYGTIYGFPYVGAVGPTDQAGSQIATFIQEVRSATGATKVDVVGHSAGAFMSLYVPKFDGVAYLIGRVVAIAPPTKGLGSQVLNPFAMYVLPGGQAELSQIEQAGGANSYDSLVVGGAPVVALDSGPIAQPGITYTIITSKYDEMVTPTADSFVHEPGVTNEYIQDFCPYDPVGHIGEAYDTNTWTLVSNALGPATATPITSCAFGAPF
ncbi:MAG: esterase/lipase family protein [Stenotrophobium sp.]